LTKKKLKIKTMESRIFEKKYKKQNKNGLLACFEE